MPMHNVHFYACSRINQPFYFFNRKDMTHGIQHKSAVRECRFILNPDAWTSFTELTQRLFAVENSFFRTARKPYPVVVNGE